MDGTMFRHHVPVLCFRSWLRTGETAHTFPPGSRTAVRQCGRRSLAGVAALDAVFDLAEDLANLVFDGVPPGGLLLEGVQVREQLLIDEGEQVVAAQGSVVVDLPVFALRRSPAFPPVWLVEDVGVFLTVQLGFGGFVAFEGVEVFQEQQPGGLFGVVQLAGASGVFPEDVADVLEGLFKH